MRKIYKKLIVVFILTFGILSCGTKKNVTTKNNISQTEKYKTLLDRAKIFFKNERNLNQEELDKLDYSRLASLLEKAVKLNPKKSEARYFLGYTYSRINSVDGRGIIDMDLELLYKTSEQFEKVIDSTPKYSGEIIVLDPYSKLTAEWGSMAMKYLFQNKRDSTVWAFRNGKKRGGFGDFILELNKNVLDACSRNSILFTLGDNYSFPLWYLQIVENYRPDVSVVDISLLNTKWYPTFLSKRNIVDFDFPNKILDTLGYTKWSDTVITINNFSWTVKPSYMEQYLLRGDRIFLSLLKENKFQRDIYFTKGFIESYRLNLKDFLTPLVLVDKLSISENSDSSYVYIYKRFEKTLKLSEKLNLNSQDELSIFDNFRYELLGNIDNYLNNNENGKAKKLMELLNKFANEKKYPYQYKEGKKYFDYVRQKI